LLQNEHDGRKNESLIPTTEWISPEDWRDLSLSRSRWSWVMDTPVMNIDSPLACADEPTPARHRAIAAEPARVVAPACPAEGARAPRPGRSNDRRRDGRGHLSAEPAAHVLALIQARHFDTAVHAVRALPTATPELPGLLDGLIWGLAQAGELEATARLVSEMLVRFPLRPELVQVLVGLAEILTSEQQLTQVFEAVGTALQQTYGFQDAASFEWAQRLAYQLRRHGNAHASACILRTWRALMRN
jgi:hypothetical protein